MGGNIRKTRKNRKPKIKMTVITKKSKRRSCIVKETIPSSSSTLKASTSDVFGEIIATMNANNTTFKHNISIPKGIRLEDDFYTWVNYNWLTAAKTINAQNPKPHARFNRVIINNENTYRDIIDIVKNYIKTERSAKSTQVSNVLKSFSALNEKAAESHVKQAVIDIDTLIEKDDMYSLLAHIGSNEVVKWGAPIVFSVTENSRDTSVFIGNISMPGLSLHDYLIYIDDYDDTPQTNKYRASVKRKYLSYIKELFDVCLGKGHGLKAKDVFEFESFMLMFNEPTNNKNNEHNEFCVLGNDESVKKYGFDWNSYSERIGYKTSPRQFGCTNVYYLKSVMEYLTENWKSEKMRTYYIYIYLRQISRFHKKWKSIHYDFYDLFINGRSEESTYDRTPIIGLGFCFNTLLTKLYIGKYPKIEENQYVVDMYNNMKLIYKTTISQNKWLTASSKKSALKKIDFLKIIVGSPESLMSDPNLEYSSTDPWGNILTMGAWTLKQDLKLDSHKVGNLDIPRIDWKEFGFDGSHVYVVNAYYSLNKNFIYIPNAYLQYPLIDLKSRGIEYNLAFIGYTIAHEIGHCIDPDSIDYDHLGNISDWYRGPDRKILNKKIVDINKQYKTFASYDGLDIDPSISLTENFTDIVGLRISVEFLEKYHSANNYSILQRYLSFCTFFTNYAIYNREVINNKAANAYTKINLHGLNKYRANCILSRLDLFKKIYNIKSNDKMYWKNSDMIW